MQQLDFTVYSNEKLNERNHLLKVFPSDQRPLPKIFPGQFVQVLVENSSKVLLRRPISVNFVEREKNLIWLLVQIVGNGTEMICRVPKSSNLNLIFPLGNSFSIPSQNMKLLLVGGGVGTAPLLFLGKVLKDKGFIPEFLLGGRSESNILQKTDFEKLGIVNYVTEDGTLGEKGLVTQHTVLQNNKYGHIYTCGPKPMMIEIAKYATLRGISCEVSLENQMACGFGACLCCVEKTKNGNICTCTEGPVFNINQLKWLD